MKLEDVQSFVAAQIAAVPALAAFGPVIQFTPFLDEVALKNQISDQLRNVGVCIEVSGVEFSAQDDPTGRGVAADALFSVWIAESPKVTHSPMGDALRKSVCAAVMAYVAHDTRAFASGDSETEISEHGYVLRIIPFKIRVSIP